MVVPGTGVTIGKFFSGRRNLLGLGEHSMPKLCNFPFYPKTYTVMSDHNFVRQYLD